MGDLCDLNQLAFTARRGERQHIHRANRHADAATDATAVDVVQLLLLQRELHHVDTHLAVPAALAAGDAFIVRADREPADAPPGIGGAQNLHELRERAPVTAPYFPAKERIERHWQDAHQPSIAEQVVVLPTDACRLSEEGHGV